MDQDIPWLYVAMIFIAFVSWIFNQVKAAQEIRRERRAEKKRAQMARRTTEAPSFPPPRGEGPSRPKSFQDVFRELERQMTQPTEPEIEEDEPWENDWEPEPVRRPTVPPPLPANSETPPVGTTPEVKPVTVSPPLQGRPAVGSPRNRETKTALNRVLRDRSQLRTALILKEVLDKPRSLQPRGRLS